MSSWRHGASQSGIPDPHILSRYISRFMWGLARATHSLSGAWRSLGRTQRHISTAAQLQRRLGLDDCPPLGAANEAVRQLHAARSAMAAFVSSLQVGTRSCRGQESELTIRRPSLHHCR